MMSFDYRLENVGVPVPKCVILKKNVLVMSFIGENQVPAPKLKDARLSFADTQIAYDQCIEVNYLSFYTITLNNQDPRLRKNPQYHLKGNSFSWYVNLTLFLEGKLRT